MYIVSLQTTSALMRVPAKDERKKKKKKKRKLIHKPKHEDDCFRCGEGGTLVMCDLPGCTKAYHMDCLTLDKLPYGKYNYLDSECTCHSVQFYPLCKRCVSACIFGEQIWLFVVGQIQLCSL
jgi:hypothetical protein